MADLIVDTNVPVVANGKHDKASLNCIQACVTALACARDGRVLIDNLGHILTEYRNNLAYRGQPGVGDAFFKWLWDNQANGARCLKVNITPIDAGWRRFVEFPDDDRLRGFDPSDQKFVAVALASTLNPPILNASDTDWLPVQHELREHGVAIEFLCPELMRET